MFPEIPETKQIAERIISDVEAEIKQDVPLLPIALIRAIAGAFAFFYKMQYKAVLWSYKQIFTQTADDSGLVLLGAVVGIYKNQAQNWKGRVDIEGQDNAVISAGTLAKSVFGVIYKFDTGVKIQDGVGVCDVSCQETGSIGQLNTNDELKLITPNGNIFSIKVKNTTQEGADEEDKEVFRTRIINRYQRRLNGASYADYEQWAYTMPNVTWVNPLSGSLPGEIFIFFEVNNQIDGIPSDDQLLIMSQYLEKAPTSNKADRKPASDVAYPKKISRTSFDFYILASNTTLEAKQEIERALNDYVVALGPFNISIMSTPNDTLTQVGASSVVNISASNLGVVVESLDVKKDGISIDKYKFIGGEKAKVGVVTWL